MGSIIGWIVFGLLVGLIARVVVPGEQKLGCLRTMLLGVVGSFIGGAFGYLFQGGSLVQSSGWIGSIVGAIVLLFVSVRRGKFIE